MGLRWKQSCFQLDFMIMHLTGVCIENALIPNVNQSGSILLSAVYYLPRYFRIVSAGAPGSFAWSHSSSGASSKPNAA